MRDAACPETANRPREQAEPYPTLVALFEEKLQAHADPGDRTPGFDPLTQSVVEAVGREPAAALSTWPTPAISASRASRAVAGSVVTTGSAPARTRAADSERRFPAP